MALDPLTRVKGFHTPRIGDACHPWLPEARPVPLI